MGECKVAHTDKSYSLPVLCTYLTDSEPDKSALYLGRAVQIVLWTILSFIQSYKIQTSTFPSAQLCMMVNLDADCVNMPQAYFQCYL